MSSTIPSYIVSDTHVEVETPLCNCNERWRLLMIASNFCLVSGLSDKEVRRRRRMLPLCCWCISSLGSSSTAPNGQGETNDREDERVSHWPLELEREFHEHIDRMLIEISSLWVMIKLMYELMMVPPDCYRIGCFELHRAWIIMIMSPFDNAVLLVTGTVSLIWDVSSTAQGPVGEEMRFHVIGLPLYWLQSTKGQCPNTQIVRPACSSSFTRPLIYLPWI